MIVCSVLGGIVALLGFELLQEKTQQNEAGFQNFTFSKNIITDTTEVKTSVPVGLNFSKAAEKVIPTVVHVHTIFKGAASDYGKSSLEELFKDFFGDGYGDNKQFSPRASSGSGVIISENGYIATNYHVIEEAIKIEVVLEDKRRFEAKVIGTDPTTDLALLKIEQNELPFVTFGDSDKLKIGQWVLAIGNPFDLTSTVTAGIVSAKARNINLLSARDNFSIESFIQTDAAVNPGNSGGALVDLDGRLVGINTAIATMTGSYSGYSFAVPAGLVQKVMDDLVNYGEVQRALMGVSIIEVDAKLAEQQDLEKIEGVFVTGLAPQGGAKEAGIHVGDVIVSVNDMPVNNTSELQERIARNRPGDKVRVDVKRKDKKIKFIVKLKNKNNTTEIVRQEKEKPTVLNEGLGAKLREISENEKIQYKLKHGIKVVEIKEGRLKSATIYEGFVITHIDKVPIYTIEDLEKALKDKKGGVLIEGAYDEGDKVFYGIGF
ncbi:MAG: trypsin-like peptidase domain-containing protein [Flammeovirgaceae bacterium]